VAASPVVSTSFWVPMKRTVENIPAWRSADAEPSAGAFIEACPDAVVVTDAALRPLMWNRRFADMWQVPAGAGARAAWRRIRSRLSERRAVLAAWRASGNEDYVDTVALTDGRYIEVRVALLDPRADTPSQVWFCRDVTARVQHDRGLREGAARYRTLVEHSPDAIYLNRLGADGRFYAESQNAEARQLNDYEDEDALGRPLDEFLPEWLAPVVLSAHQKCRETAHPVRYELVAPPGDGDWARDCILMPICDESGVVTRTVLISRDVTQRRHQEQHLGDALRQAEAAEQRAERDRAILIDAIEAIQDGFVMFDRDERLVRCNTAFLRGAGIASLEAATGMSLEAVVRSSMEAGVLDPGDIDPEHYLAEGLAVMRRGHGLTEAPAINGRWLRIEPLRVSDGGIVAIVSDISSIKRREAQMAEAAGRAETAERQAAQAEARLVEAIETLPAAFMLFDRDEKLVLANSQSREMFPLAADLLQQPGTSYEMLVRRNLADERNPAGPDEFETRVAERLADFRRASGNAERPLANGRWLRASDRRTPSGDTVALRVDVTEGRVREHALAEASVAWTEREAQLRRIYANIPGVVYQLRMGPERALHFEYISERALEIFGVTPAAVQDDSELVFGRVHPEDRMSLEAAIAGAAANLTPWDGEFRIDAGATTRWLRGSALPTALGGGTVLWDGVLVDVTATKSAEADALDARRRLEDAIESLSEGFALFDAAGRLVLANSRLAEIHAAVDPAFVLAPGLGFEPALRGLVASGRLDDVEGFLARRLEEFRQGNGAWEVQLANGQWLQGTERRMRDGGVVAMRRDITLLKRREEQLRAAMIEATTANKAKSEFLANMSHELRTPLNAIIGFSEMIGSEIFGPLGNARYGGYVSDIHSSGQHLLSIINTVLDLARVEAGKIVLSDGIVDVDGLIGDCATLMRERSLRGRLRLRLDVEPELPVLRADPVRLKQIVLNLLSNAIKFTKAHGQVTMRAGRSAEGGIDIEISDTGIGMDPRNIARALEPFGLVHAAHSRAHEGTGLGLPLSKALIEEHGGQLVLTSAIGVGTTATVKMPPERIIRPSVGREPSRRS
jgi:PAS domain S-box-containing protein